MTNDLEHELRKTRAILRLAYVEQRWGKIDLDTVPSDPNAKRRREIVVLDMLMTGILPEQFVAEACQIANQYREQCWDYYLPLTDPQSEKRQPGSPFQRKNLPFGKVSA